MIKLPIPSKAFAAILLSSLVILPLCAEDLLRNASFDDEMYGWSVSISSESGTASVLNDGPDGAHALTFDISQPGKTDMAFHQNVDLGLTQSYRLTFWARSDSPAYILIVPAMDYGEYGPVADGWGVTLTPEWKQHEKTFTVYELDSRARLNFLTPNELPVGKIQFAQFSLEGVE